MKTDTSELALEALIVRAMAGRAESTEPPYPPHDTTPPLAGGIGWILGDPTHYLREYAVDITQLRGFLKATQEPLVDQLGLDHEGPTRSKFLARLQGEIA